PLSVEDIEALQNQTLSLFLSRYGARSSHTPYRVAIGASRALLPSVSEPASRANMAGRLD
ncbi:hypothetical protein E2320_002511, partial [Naja naja]